MKPMSSAKKIATVSAPRAAHALQNQKVQLRMRARRSVASFKPYSETQNATGELAQYDSEQSLVAAMRQHARDLMPV
jgi:hypothetical protein